jgi:hypothetical protein
MKWGCGATICCYVHETVDSEDLRYPQLTRLWRERDQGWPGCHYAGSREWPVCGWNPQNSSCGACSFPDVVSVDCRMNLGHHIQFHNTHILTKKSGCVECIIRKRYRLSYIMTTWTGEKVSLCTSHGSLSFEHWRNERRLSLTESVLLLLDLIVPYTGLFWASHCPLLMTCTLLSSPIQWPFHR